MKNGIPSHWSQGNLEINQGQLHYYRTGVGTKPPLVLMHGFSDDGLCWLPTALDLESEYDILMPDARGHGLSARVVPGQRLDHAADLAEMINALGLVKPVIAGHSMGAMIAGQIGTRFPDLPHALILEDPPWFLLPPGTSFADLPARRNPMGDSVKSLANSTVEELVQQAEIDHPTWSDDVRYAWCSAKKRLDQNITSTFSFDFRNWQSEIEKITCPTLLIASDPLKGGLVTSDAAQIIAQANPNITIHQIPNVGHHIRFENYPEYMRIVRRFLAER